MKKAATLSALAVLLFTQHPHAQTASARIYFIDVGTGASTLIVSPTGKTLLVDGGPPGSGAKITALLNTLGIATIDNTVLTHYHIDHMGGLIEVLNAGKIAGTSYDNGDDPALQPPGSATSSTSTRGTYLNYVAATGHQGVTRKTVQPGAIPDGFLDLGGGLRATFVAAGGRFLSGGHVAITNEDLNSESISTLVEFNAFDYLISGDMTGGGSTSTAKTPDVETFVAQMVGDVDVVQLDHHGSTTANNQVFLAALKAEVAFAQTGDDNTFGHPNRETANKYLNTPDTIGASFTGTGVPPPGVGPVFYQNEASPANDERVTQQGYTGAAAGHHGQGTVLLTTDGTTSYMMTSFDDGGVHINPAQHTYAVDGVSNGITTDFKPTVIVQTTPVLPLATESVAVSAVVNDRESPITSVTLLYRVNGVAQPSLPMSLNGGVYQATIPAQSDGVRIDYTVTGSTGGQSSIFSLGYFSGVTPIAVVRAETAKGEPLFNGYAARVRGTVTASGFTPGTNDDYVQDSTGAINVYRSTQTPTPYTATTPGQSVEAFGRINFNGGRFRLDLTESVEKSSSPYGIVALSAGNSPAPATTTLAALATNTELLEGRLFSVPNCIITSGSIPTTPQAVDAFVTIADSTGSFSMKIEHDTDVEGFAPTSPFTVTGILQQDDYLRPFDSGYNLTPRSRVDLGAAAPAPVPVISIADARVDRVNNVDGTAGADFIPDRLNQVVKIHGTVTSIDFRGGNGIDYYAQDGTGGIDVFSAATNFGPFSVGDTVEALGTITQFFGLTELTVNSVSLLSHGAAPTPLKISLSQLANGGGETFEGQLVTVTGVRITSGAFPAANGSAAVTIADTTGTGALYIDSDTDIDGTTTPAGTITVTGVVGQHATTTLNNDGYQIIPRSLADIVPAASGPPLVAFPPTLTFATTSVGSVLMAPFTLTNNGSSALTLTTPFVISGADAGQFAVAGPGVTTLVAHTSTTASVAFAPTSGGVKNATINISSSAGSTSLALTGIGQAAGGATIPIVIDEFRLHGPSGGNDEFVSIYNNSDVPVDISGDTLHGSNGAGASSVRATVPANVVLPARAHYLFANTTTHGYSSTVGPNVTYTSGMTDDGGVAIFSATATVIDQVGLSVSSAFKEGTRLAPLTTNTNRAYQRKTNGVGTFQDTGDNATDFQLISPASPQNVVLATTPASINFGATAQGETRAQIITVRNLLLTVVTLNAPVLSGTDVAAFASSTLSATSLPPGGTATLTVTFRPTDNGTSSASIVITSSSVGTVAIPLRGMGTAAQPEP